MKNRNNLFTLTMAAMLFALMGCDPTADRQDQMESFRDDYRDWEQDYQEKIIEIEEARGPVMRWHETFKGDVIPEPRTIGGVTEVPVIMDTAAKEQLVPRIAELNQKHESIRDEHQALLDKHLSFMTRTDLATISDEEWDNQKDLIRSDQDRIENDHQALVDQWEEMRNQIEDISAPSERTGARTAPAPTVDPATTPAPRRNQ